MGVKCSEKSKEKIIVVMITEMFLFVKLIVIYELKYMYR